MRDTYNDTPPSQPVWLNEKFKQLIISSATVQIITEKKKKTSSNIDKELQTR